MIIRKDEDRSSLATQLGGQINFVCIADTVISLSDIVARGFECRFPNNIYSRNSLVPIRTGLRTLETSGRSYNLLEI